MYLLLFFSKVGQENYADVAVHLHFKSECIFCLNFYPQSPYGDEERLGATPILGF